MSSPYRRTWIRALRATAITALSLAALALAGCSSDADGNDGPVDAASDASAEVDTTVACDPIAPVARESAELTIDDDGRLRDAHGRAVRLRGMNTGGRSKWTPYLPFPIDDDASIEDVSAAASDYFAPLPGWGLNVVRMPFSWEGLEPVEGEFDERYLARYEAMVDAAWAAGLAVIVDFHQDVYASPFCGDGFPLWTIPGEVGEPRRDCPEWFNGYVSDPDVRAAFDRFWANEGGVQSAFRGMWRRMANRFADHPGVVGFEVINEPGWGTARSVDNWKREVLAPFYADMTQLLRSLAPTKLVFYDGPGVDALAINAFDFAPEAEDVVYAPHLYDAALLASEGWSGHQPDERLAAIAEFAEEQALPVLIGEFGYGFGASGGADWLELAMDGIDEHGFSATLWEYSLSDELWNHENLSVVEPDGTERPILDVYVRPHLRAVAGTDASFSFDPDTRQAVASWTASSGVTEIAVPTSRFGEPTTLSVEGDGACSTFDGGAGALRVTAAEGAEVTVMVGW